MKYCKSYSVAGVVKHVIVSDRPIAAASVREFDDVGGPVSLSAREFALDTRARVDANELLSNLEVTDRVRYKAGVPQEKQYPVKNERSVSK